MTDPGVNYHFHDDASSDGRAPLAEHCDAAEAAGLTAVCVTNHVETMLPSGRWVVELDEAVERFSAEGRSAAQEDAARPDLDVRLGAEFEYRPEWTDDLDRLAERVPFDFVLGSVHLVDGLNVSGGPEVDDYFDGRSLEEAYAPYFDALAEMVEWGGFDAVAHFDLVKRYGHDHFGAYDPGRFEDRIRGVLAAMADAGVGIEVNASGLAQAPAAPYPSERILAWAREEGVPFLTAGTDSHRPEDLATGLEEAVDSARRGGWRELAVLEDRRVAETRSLDVGSRSTAGGEDAGRREER